MNRKQRRKDAKIKEGLSPSERNLSEKIFMFEQIPDVCTTCAAPFDKADKGMAISWRVVVREEKQQVRLFCPACVTKAKEVIEKHG
tara:strand:- start:2244 stop:2501 length:258 start_codon:yes stop_codon:yes gene_type:complete